ncbi:peptide methionine sulfoxide reductase [Roseivirga seohaensis subsp. aquiponti]|uniref:Peptide methionine sulfoxide reductase MsrA n=1 Tax=Roseivirga seohaensis subsp. aquiponti TaxID=1566026 RepID=A0A0L8AGI3_9BACT|nr:peptide-methionine (S)-S-oxide reductase MsrA [Roseivirga seohaensis]KOF01396.1 peptide methionine sulfoxide reductase [Roseivirga seohaensis subsp. aquiponti]
MHIAYTLITSLLLNFGVSSCSNVNSTELVNLEAEVQKGNEIATFAGGCFWCTEAVFERVNGVKNVVSGYTGGKENNPTYEDVSYGRSTHAEAIQIYYDPKVISYQELLEVFFYTHDPTQVNRQGPDVGTQYRTEVFYHDENQKKLATDYISKLNQTGKYNKPIATKVTEYTKFWLAEDYHQNYYELNPGNPYIINIAVPKVNKLKEHFPNLIKKKYASEK